LAPHVSICIPAFEQPELLVRTLRSVFQQTYSDFEVIVTDDSRSSSVQAAMEPWLDDPRMRYMRNPSRLGSPRNWNRALELAQGSLIKILHQDDWFSGEHSLEKYVSLLAQPDISFGFSAAVACDADGVLLFRHVPTQDQVAALKADPRCLFVANFVGAPSATIFRRKGDFRFDPNLKWLVDVEAYVRMLRKEGRFGFTPELLINVTASAPHQVTREVQNAPLLQLRENAYVYRLLGFKGLERVRFVPYFWSLIKRVSPAELNAAGWGEGTGRLPAEIRIPIMLQLLRSSIGRLKRWFGRRWRSPGSETRSHTDGEPKKSFSQCGEDLIVDFVFMWLGMTDIRYLDIGANHPRWLNNTYFFYANGGKGVLVEPDPELCRFLSEDRPRDRCLNVAIGVDGRPSATMYVMTSRTLSTLSPVQAADYESYGREKVERTIDVAQRDINDVLAREFERSPNFVSLDVEGLDLAILKQWDFDRFRPEVFCIETLTFTQNGTERKLSDIVDFMKSKRYFVYADTYINTVFVSAAAWEKRPT
jgi:FkbM family methyltransferase